MLMNKKYYKQPLVRGKRLAIINDDDLQKPFTYRKYSCISRVFKAIFCTKSWGT